jgi:hypothetical protein
MIRHCYLCGWPADEEYADEAIPRGRLLAQKERREERRLQVEREMSELPTV